MFSSAQVKDRVWDIRHGFGVIHSIEIGSMYPINVVFDKTYMDRKISLNYSLEGKITLSDNTPVLFWNEFKIPPEAFIKPLPKLAVDTKVIVWDEVTNKYSRHFYEFTENGLIRTYSKGATSFSTNNFIETWNHYEIYKEQ